MITFYTQKKMRLLKKMYLVIMSSTLILMYNNYHLAIHKKMLKKNPIKLITMSMNLFKICDIGFVKFYAEFVYIKAILSLHNISSIEQ